jgi:succinate dehydrogenase / fumarate reductase cytochrome b subunit
VVDKKRPVNLDIGTFRLPITAYVSILHRVSGVITFFTLTVIMWLLDQSLSSRDGFDTVRQYLGLPIAQFVVWATLAILAYHSVVGIRHLVMDAGIGEEDFNSGRFTAWIALAFAVIIIVLLGWWIFV